MGLKKLPSRPRRIAKNSGYLVQRDGRLGSKGNFELVVNNTSGPSRLEYWHRDNDNPDFPWIPTSTFASNVLNSPALIQSNFGLKGNFEVVFRNSQSYSLEHWYRDNDDPNLQWHKTSNF